MSYVIDTPETDVVGSIIFAHGAGAPMDSEFMLLLTAQLLAHGLQVIRFNFPYMQKMQATGKKRPPDRQPILLDYWRDIHQQVCEDDRVKRPLLIGGKSMGGRMASMVADTLSADGLCCVGYPFHPPGKLDRMRVEQFANMTTPCLIFQGTRDPFGKPDELWDIPLSKRVSIHWLEDGNHDLCPRQSSQFSQQAHLEAVAFAIATFAKTLPRPASKAR